MAELSRLRIGTILYSFNDAAARAGNIPPGGEKLKALVKETDEDHEMEWASLEALYTLHFSSANVNNETLYLIK